MDRYRTSDEASPHAPKVISCGKPALFSGVGYDPIMADICHLDEAWRRANGPKDTLIIAFFKRPTISLAPWPHPHILVHDVNRPEGDKLAS
jgi:hypothetical protein